MADDREILREVWDGRIPVCFVLAREEVDSLEGPEPYFVSLYLIQIACGVFNLFVNVNMI